MRIELRLCQRPQSLRAERRTRHCTPVFTCCQPATPAARRAAQTARRLAATPVRRAGCTMTSTVVKVIAFLRTCAGEISGQVENTCVFYDICNCVFLVLPLSASNCFNKWTYSWLANLISSFLLCSGLGRAAPIELLKSHLVFFIEE